VRKITQTKERKVYNNAKQNKNEEEPYQLKSLLRYKPRNVLSHDVSMYSWCVSIKSPITNSKDPTILIWCHTMCAMQSFTTAVCQQEKENQMEYNLNEYCGIYLKLGVCDNRANI
jgi:hypothetical protein